jgi:uncharacterized protein (DUF488 family)
MKDLLIHTIGHANHEVAAFIDLLRRHEILLVVDVRSQPYSQWASQFNRELLAHDLEAAGIAYRFMGDVLGGRPADPALYESGEDRPDYARMAQSLDYKDGIDRLLDLARAGRVVVMCGEGDHRQCHRHLLITQTLLQRGARVLHIRPDGTTVEGEPVAQQLSLL